MVRVGRTRRRIPAAAADAVRGRGRGSIRTNRRAGTLGLVLLAGQQRQRFGRSCQCQRLAQKGIGILPLERWQQSLSTTEANAVAEPRGGFHRSIVAADLAGHGGMPGQWPEGSRRRLRSGCAMAASRRPSSLHHLPCLDIS